MREATVAVPIDGMDVAARVPHRGKRPLGRGLVRGHEDLGGVVLGEAASEGGDVVPGAVVSIESRIPLDRHESVSAAHPGSRAVGHGVGRGAKHDEIVLAGAAGGEDGAGAEGAQGGRGKARGIGQCLGPGGSRDLVPKPEGTVRRGVRSPHERLVVGDEDVERRARGVGGSRRALGAPAHRAVVVEGSVPVVARVVGSAKRQRDDGVGPVAHSPVVRRVVRIEGEDRPLGAPGDAVSRAVKENGSHTVVEGNPVVATRVVTVELGSGEESQVGVRRPDDGRGGENRGDPPHREGRRQNPDSQKPQAPISSMADESDEAKSVPAAGPFKRGPTCRS